MKALLFCDLDDSWQVELIPEDPDDLKLLFRIWMEDKETGTIQITAEEWREWSAKA